MANKVMNYENIKMYPPQRTHTRYSLIKDGAKMLIVVGFNPSTADDTKIDATMRFVLGIAEFNEYDGFAMVNLYPLRSTNPDDLPLNADEELIKENFSHIDSILEEYPTADILLAYGNLVNSRPYTKEIARNLLELFNNKSRQIYCLAKLRSGNPKHPLRTPFSTKLQKFLQ